MPQDNAYGVCPPDTSTWPINPDTGLPYNPATTAQPALTQGQSADMAALGIVPATGAVTDMGALMSSAGAPATAAAVANAQSNAAAAAAAAAPKKPTGLALAAGAGAAGFFLGGPVGAAVGAALGFLVGKPKAVVAPPPASSAILPDQYVPGMAPPSVAVPQVYSPDASQLQTVPNGFPGSTSSYTQDSPPPGFPVSTQYQTGGLSGFRRGRR